MFKNNGFWSEQPLHTIFCRPAPDRVRVQRGCAAGLPAYSSLRGKSRASEKRWAFARLPRPIATTCRRKAGLCR